MLCHLYAVDFKSHVACAVGILFRDSVIIDLVYGPRNETPTFILSRLSTPLMHLILQIIRNSSTRIAMEVWYAGQVPGSYETHQEYSWIDVFGRPTSPPLEVDRSERYKASGMRKSGLMLLKDDDERKVV